MNDYSFRLLVKVQIGTTTLENNFIIHKNLKVCSHFGKKGVWQYPVHLKMCLPCDYQFLV